MGEKKTDKKVDDGYRKMESNEIIKLEKAGDYVEGEYITIEESKKFKDSYAVKFLDEGKPKVVFVNNMAYELFINNGVEKGAIFKLVYETDKKSGDGKNEYRVFDLFVKE